MDSISSIDEVLEVTKQNIVLLKSDFANSRYQLSYMISDSLVERTEVLKSVDSLIDKQ